MKLIKREPLEGQGMNMTPMIDVVFQLLIFFMLVAEISSSESAELILPRASQAVADEGEPGRHIINVDKEGHIKVGSAYFSLDELENRILVPEALVMRDKSGKFSEKPILIRADKEAKFGIVQKIMGRCVRQKIYKISFGAMTAAEIKPTGLRGGIN